MGFEWRGRVQEVAVGYGKGHGLESYFDRQALFLILRPVSRAIGKLAALLPGPDDNTGPNAWEPSLLTVRISIRRNGHELSVLDCLILPPFRISTISMRPVWQTAHRQSECPVSFS